MVDARSRRGGGAVTPAAAPSMLTGARVYYDPPPPRPRRRTVLDVATVVQVSDPHLLLGAEYETALCGPLGVLSTNCGVAPDKTPSTITTMTGDPFAIYNLVECAPFGHSPEALLRLAEEGLRYKEASGVEGALGTLLSAGAQSAGTPTGAADGVALLDTFLLTHWAGEGLILTNPTVATAWHAARAVTLFPDGRLMTPSGTEVVVGAFGSAKTAYSVGRLILLKGPMFSAMVPMDLPSPTNTTRALAERTWVPLAECDAGKVTLS